MDVPLYVTCIFSFAAFRILSLFYVLSVLIMMCLGVFLFVSDGLVFCRLFASWWSSLSRGQGMFQLLLYGTGC
jgi:hypothetical protein